MAKIVGGHHHVTHVPYIGRARSPATCSTTPTGSPSSTASAPVHEWLAEVKPDIAVVIYNDHGLNFFLDKMPTFAVGAAAEYSNADEGWGIPTVPPYKGDQDLSWHLIESLMEDDFDLVDLPGDEGRPRVHVADGTAVARPASLSRDVPCRCASTPCSSRCRPRRAASSSARPSAAPWRAFLGLGCPRRGARHRGPLAPARRPTRGLHQQGVRPACSWKSLMKVQVAIVGAGPSGLHPRRSCCTRPASTPSSSKAQTPEYVLGRIRAGVLEQVAVDLLDEAGVGARMHRRGPAARRLRAAVRRRRATASTCRAHRRQAGDGLWPDRGDARPDGRARGGRAGDGVRGKGRQPARLRHEKPARALPQGRRDARDRVRLHRRLRRLPRRLPRQRAEGAIRNFERVYPFGWLGLLSDTPPVSDELIYAKHERGFALCSMRSHTRSRYYVQVPLTRRSRTGATSASGTSCAGASTRRRRRVAGHRPLDREEHRAAAQLRRRADALRAPVPRRRRRAHRAADRRQGPEPRRVRRALPVARAHRVLPAASSAGIDHYSRAACAGSGRPSASPGG
jgi:hypothetical protein